MTSPDPAVAQCDICDAEPAVMSQMNLSNYSCIRVGQACMVPFLLSTIQAITGLEPDLTTPASPATEPAPEGHHVTLDGPAEPAGPDCPARPAGPRDLPRAARRKPAGK